MAGERVTAFRLPGSVALHDGAMFVAIVLVAGHLFLALVWPASAATSASPRTVRTPPSRAACCASLETAATGDTYGALAKVVELATYATIAATLGRLRLSPEPPTASDAAVCHILSPLCERYQPPRCLVIAVESHNDKHGRTRPGPGPLSVWVP